MANASEILEPSNPANVAPEPKGNRKHRVPMSVALRRLEVPEIAGYHLHWIKEANVGRALQAAYEFVGFDEVPQVNQRNPGTDTELSGSTDLGSHVSFVAGTGADGKPERLILMKLLEEYWREDRAQIDGRNAAVMGSIFRGEKILDKDQVSSDVEQTRYVDPERTYERRALFSRRRPKA
jgi:hypothetical protein